MITAVMPEYRVSQRVVLRPGDRFRVTGGPYWRCGDGKRLAMAERGVLTFNRAIRRGAVVLIEARSQDGYCVIHVAGRRRNRVDPALVCRPYRIKARLRDRLSVERRDRLHDSTHSLSVERRTHRDHSTDSGGSR